MNNELIEEKAQLYALGILPESEVEEFETQIKSDRQLRDLVHEYQRLTELDLYQGKDEAPFHVYSKVMEQLDGPKQSEKRNLNLSQALSWGGWAVAACVAAVMWLGGASGGQVGETSSDIVVNNLGSPRIVPVPTPSDEYALEDRMLELAGLAEAYWFSREGIPEGQLLESDDAEVTQLSGGFTVFDKRFNIGFIAVENLPKEAPDRSYHVWARTSESETPVRAGTLPIGEESRGLFFFDLTQLPQGANVDSLSFFVTEEKEESPSSPSKMVVLKDV
ncbi:anti-sigma factor domain-containing protein [Pelagicoccus albus]|uniref:Anti-sigma-K factor RskA n=1 Tax=Pelagicoccus albus TaxID=415222 RepID=A0A7X1B7S6_9BACT|nr:anti-sigma factor [Pelagicoccus albus]MBC2607240.1 hypothetical protein [Pelagicoccus albus]